MVPITLLALQKVSQILTSGDAFAQSVRNLGTEFGLRIPALPTNNILLSLASADIADRNVQLTYPRISLSSEGVKNAREEKFRSFSGSVSVAALVLASANLVSDAETWLHYYVEALTTLLQDNLGDWGDGVFYGGLYEVQFQPPKVGGIGFVQPAKVAFELLISRD